MQNFIKFLIESHSLIFSVWLGIFYFSVMFYLKKIYLKLDDYTFYNYFLKKKNQADFDLLDSKTDNEHYSDEDLKVIEYRKKSLIFQSDLKINEKNLNILKFLSLYENSSEALSLYRNCREILNYDSHAKKLTIKEVFYKHDFEQKRKIISWIWIIGIILNFIFILFLLLDPSVTEYSGNLLGLIGLIFLTSFLVSLIIFKVSRHYERYNDAQKLLNLSRIEKEMLND